MQKLSNQVFSAPLSLSPGEERQISAFGTHIRILSSSSDTSVNVAVVGSDGGISASWPMGSGQAVPVVTIENGVQRLAPFQKVVFYNPSGTETINFEFSISVGEMSDSGAVIRGSVQIDPSGPAIESPASLTVTQDALSNLPADVRIKERLIQNTGEFPVWVGDSNVDPATGRGQVLNPGGACSLNCWGAVSFKAEGGTSRVSIVNILKVN